MANAWQPYVEACIENFGANRCMFESNFPVDKGACSYPVLFNAFKRLAAAPRRWKKPIVSPAPPHGFTGWGSSRSQPPPNMWRTAR
jgi:predicted TIM-barrel fold metal-dependent hydrolase